MPNAIRFYRALSHGLCDEALTRALAEAVVALPAWLESLGAQLEWLELGLDFPGLPGADSFGRVVSIASEAEFTPRAITGSSRPLSGSSTSIVRWS